MLRLAQRCDVLEATRASVSKDCPTTSHRGQTRGSTVVASMARVRRQPADADDKAPRPKFMRGNAAASICAASVRWRPGRCFGGHDEAA
eukprot:9540233-Alexandrium_andersonii.AAC.1